MIDRTLESSYRLTQCEILGILKAMTSNWKPWHKPQNCQQLIDILSLLPKHWSLTPLRQKRPFRKNWQREENLSRPYLIKLINTGESQISQSGRKWQSYISGYGLRTGNASGGLLAIDFDGSSSANLFEAIWADETKIETVSWTSGKPGRKQLLFQVPPEFQPALEKFTRLVLTDYAGISCLPGDMLEFRYNNCQSALPPSYHPETGSYEWICPPWQTPVALLPNSLIQFLPEKPFSTNSSRYTSRPTAYDQDKLVSALYQIDPDCPYEHWLKVGMALKSESDSYFYLKLWDSWSSKGTKYKPWECERKWRSFQNLRVSLGSLFYLAKLYS